MSLFSYIIRRLCYMVVVLLILSIAAFILIELPPGDYLNTLIHQMRMHGELVDPTYLASLRKQFGLDLPVYIRYFFWLKNMLHGNFGFSFAWNRAVADILAERIPLTIMISSLSMIFVYSVAIPIGIYSAVHQYSVGDYIFTAVGFAGLAIPNFLFALGLMTLFQKYFGWNVTGLLSPKYQMLPWSLNKFIDFLKHLPVPIIVIGTAGTAGIIRVMRGCLLDELEKQYVVTARAKGLSEKKLLFKYPVRIAINPIISTIGWTLPAIVSGETITAIVLALPTTGPLLYKALMTQDVYMAGSTIMLLSTLTVIGTLISDILLVWFDPRIRYEKST